MKTNEKPEGVARIAPRSLVLAGLLVGALCFAGPSRAQSSAGSAPSAAVKQADAGTRQAQAPPAAPQASSSAAAAKPATPAEKSPASQAKGGHEGITVHGHWVIEVKNPDGKVTTRREFENALCCDINGTVGANLLAGLLSGNYAPGPWAIALSGSATSGPCSTGTDQFCFIISPFATSHVSADQCSTSLAKVSSGTQPWCYDTLTESLSASGNGGYFTTFTLSGAAYADTSTTITGVATAQTVCPSRAPSAPGTAVSPATTAPSDCLANSTGALAFNYFTSAQVSIPVIAGQTVSATVVISFGSQ